MPAVFDVCLWLVGLRPQQKAVLECLFWAFTSISLNSATEIWSNYETGWGCRLLSSYEGCHSPETQLSPLGLPWKGMLDFPSPVAVPCRSTEAWPPESPAGSRGPPGWPLDSRAKW